MRMLPCGAQAVLVEFHDLDEVQSCYAALRRDPPAGVTELVPAARTVLVAFDENRTTVSAVRAAVERVERSLAARPRAGRRPNASPETAGRLDRLVEIVVRYDGPDLADVAQRAGLSEDEVVRRHTATEHQVAFCGFAPGFAYITGLDPLLRLPRRARPRTRVPAGAVAIADGFTGVYPAASPGGWNLIGTTDLRTFDLDRDPPAALPPGTRVRFVALPPAAEAPARSAPA